MTLTALFWAVSALSQGQDEDYNRRLAILLERMDRMIDDAATELLEKGNVSERNIRLSDVLFNQFSYAFKIVYEEYLKGDRKEPTDELRRAEEIMKDIVRAKEVQGGWLVKAAHRRVVPRVQASLAGVHLAAPWDACDGSERDCVTCQVKQFSK